MSEYSDFPTTFPGLSRIYSYTFEHRREVNPGFANYLGLLCNKSCQTMEQPSLTLPTAMESPSAFWDSKILQVGHVPAATAYHSSTVLRETRKETAHHPALKYSIKG